MYVIDINSFLPNAMIEIMEKKGIRKAKMKDITEYGRLIVHNMRETKILSVLILSKDRTYEFFTTYNKLFEIKDDEAPYVIVKENITADDLRKIFRTQIPMDILPFFTDSKTVNVLYE